MIHIKSKKDTDIEKKTKQNIEQKIEQISEQSSEQKTEQNAEQSSEQKAEQNTEQKTANKKSKKKNLMDYNIVRFLMVLLLLAACAGIGSGYAVYEDRLDPTEFVAEYFGQFLLRKYDKMYEMVDIDDEMVSKEGFAALMKDIRAGYNVTEYEFKKPAETKDGRYFVKVVYKDGASGESKSMDIFLAQKKNMVTNAFVSWKISIDDYIVRDFAVAVPVDMKLEIDSVTIDDSMAEISTESMSELHLADGTVKLAGDDEQMKIYHIDSILMGAHQLKAYGPYSRIVEEVKVENDGFRIILPKEKEEVNAGYKKKLKETTENMISAYYDSVKNRKDMTDKLKGYFAKDKELLKTVKKYTAKDIARIYWEDVRYIEDYTLKEQKFSDIKTTSKYIGGDSIEVDCKFSFTYKCATDTDVYISYVSSYNGKCDVSLKLIYKKSGDEFVITSIEKKTEDTRLEN